MRDYRRLAPQKLRKRELRALVTEMRLRHDDEVRELLALLPAEVAVRWTMERAKVARWRRA